ncbi:allantoin racemase [Dethiosulfatibacter aminovorans DSM 17477]|uniref:Allantoin racemase n=1 Tax=Dethiosulfatibacter aminovorans DSM 17477 TaxID=1121476 RepID=A0A1M6HQG0_9FIRM|nr:aspartate/glutamate racemase family protein [Dethiosulfatibacter aminovorans]SHJ24462.1 allantoin racemase [Dethiosulfatibacter aminovorans DSM 17477]
MRIKVIVPVIKTQNTDLMDGEYEYIESSLPPGTEFDIKYLDFGSESVESVTEQSFAVPEILRIAKKSEEEGFDGIFIDCFADPGVFPSREIVRIPVVGGFIPSMALASTLGERIAILATSNNFRKNLEKTVRSSAFEDSIVSLNNLDLTVLELLDRDKALSRLADSCKDIVKRDNADVIVLGCTVMYYLIDDLKDRLRYEGCRVQIIEPKRSGLKMLTLMAELNLTNSMNHIVSANYDKIKKH